MDLLRFDPIGKKHINNIYEYYDEPLVYSFYSDLGNLFLANLVDVDDDSEMYTWTFLPLTQKELHDIENKNTTLFKLYTESTSNVIYICEEVDDMTKYYSLLKSDLEEEYLPAQDSYIELFTPKKSTLTNVELIENRTIKSNRYIVDLSFEVDGKHDQEIEVNLLGNALIDFQELVHAANLPSHIAKQAPISDEVKNNNRLKVTDTYAASFGVRMESEVIANLLSDDSIKQSLEKVVGMFETLENYEDSKQQLKEFSPKSKYKFLSMIETLGNNKVDGKLTVAIPNGDSTKLLVTRFKDEAMRTYLKKAADNIIHTKMTLTSDGVLMAFDSKTSTFKFATEESDYSFVYNGKLGLGITDSTSAIPRKGKSTILVETKTKEFTGEESHKYTLLDWVPE